MPKVIDKLKEPSKTLKASTDLTEASKLVTGIKDILGAFKELKGVAGESQQQQTPVPAPASVGANPSMNMAKEMNPDLKNAVPKIVLREDKIDELLKQLFESIPKSMEEDTLKSLKEKADKFAPLIKPRIKEAILQIAKIEYEK